MYVCVLHMTYLGVCRARRLFVLLFISDASLDSNCTRTEYIYTHYKVAIIIGQMGGA